MVAPEFAKRLGALVEAAGYDYAKEFARDIGRPASMVSDWLRGYVRPQPPSVDHIATVLSIRLKRKLCREDICPVSEMSDPSGALSRISTRGTAADTALDHTAEAATLPGTSHTLGEIVRMLEPEELQLLGFYRAAVKRGDTEAAERVLAVAQEAARPKTRRRSGGAE